MKPKTTMKKNIVPVATKKINSKKELLSLVRAPGNQEFWVNRGPVLRNLKDLVNYLEVIDVERYKFHTRNGGNDFANWVKEVLHDTEAAEGLKKAKTVSSSLSAITKALKRYKI